MKGKIRRIIASLAILVLVVTLAPLANTKVATAAPSFDTWEVITIPSATGNVISACDVTDMAMGPDGTTIYVCDAQGNRLLKSIDGGHCFSDITAGLFAAGYNGPPRLVALAPDNPSAVVVVDSTPAVAGTSCFGRVFMSINGGTTWTALPLVPDNASGANSVLDIAVSAAVSTAIMGRHLTVAVSADAASNTSGGCFYIIGDTVTWQVAGPAIDTYDCTSVAFSPGYVGDRTIVGVGSNATDTFLLMYTIATPPGTAVIPDILIETTLPTPTDSPSDYDIAGSDGSIISSDIALPSDFDSLDYSRQMVYVCWNQAGPGYSDAYRINSTNVFKLEIAPDVDLHSISYSGIVSGGTLFAGGVAPAAPGDEHVPVWYSNDPTSLLPSWYHSAKPPTGTSNCVVEVAPNFTTSNAVYAGTRSAANEESALSISTNGGLCFNQWSLIDTTIVGLSDVMPTPDGAVIFLASWNDAGANVESLWRSPLPASSCSWQRIRISIVGGVSDDWGNAGGETIIRLGSEWLEAASIYWCDRHSTNIQYSHDGGSCFNACTAPAPITDVAVEGSQTLYLASGSNVYKSTSGCRVWGPPVPANIGPVFMLAMAPMPGNVLVGGTGGAASYSIDGGLSFMPLPTLPTGGNVQIAADENYAGNNTVYAASSNGGVYRWVVSSALWVGIRSATAITNVSGLAMGYGCLYAADATPGGGADRTRNPTASAPSWDSLTNGLTGGETFAQVPSALRCVENTLFAIDTTHNVLYEYIDTKCTQFEEDKFIYSVKFLCGRAKSVEVGVEPADYATAINIHNFHGETVVLKKKVVIARRESEPQGEVSPYIELSLGPNRAVEIDCLDICNLWISSFSVPPPTMRELLGDKGFVAAQGPSQQWTQGCTSSALSSIFLKGFVVIESTQPLNIVAVYTVNSGWGWWGEVNIDVEHISPVVSP